MSSASLATIYNFRQATPDLATSGQPTEERLRSIADAGYRVIINLALHDDPRYSLKDEAGFVRALGSESPNGAPPVALRAACRQVKETPLGNMR